MDEIERNGAAGRTGIRGLRSRIVCNDLDSGELEQPRVQGWRVWEAGSFRGEITDCASREELAAWQEPGLGWAHALVGLGPGGGCRRGVRAASGGGEQRGSGGGCLGPAAALGATVRRGAVGKQAG